MRLCDAGVANRLDHRCTEYESIGSRLLQPGADARRTAGTDECQHALGEYDAGDRLLPVALGERAHALVRRARNARGSTSSSPPALGLGREQRRAARGAALISDVMIAAAKEEEEEEPVRLTA
jgi:hypothetical protein